MNRKTIEILTQLKENPSSEKVDHILLLQKIYYEYSNGFTELKPIAIFYLNGFDDLPALREKYLWNELKFEEIRKDFIDSHNELVELIDETLNGIKDNKSDSFVSFP